MSALFCLISQSNPSLKEQKSSIPSLLQVLSNMTVLMHGNILQSTVQMGVLRFKVLVLINDTFQWYMLTHSNKNIAIADMHRLASRILYVSNAFQNTNVPIHERVCVVPPPYYLDWFEISYPNFPLN